MIAGLGAGEKERKERDRETDGNKLLHFMFPAHAHTASPEYAQQLSRGAATLLGGMEMME